MNLLSQLKIHTKLASIVVLAAITVCSIVGASAWLSRNRMLDDRVAQMRTAVDLLYGVAQSLQDDVAAGKMSVTEAKE
jgi:methyl-accepting chemotaxis protein